MAVIFFYLIPVGCAFWAWSDARSLRTRGIRVGGMGPGGWFWGVFLLLVVFGPLYLFSRSKALHRSPTVASQLEPVGTYRCPSCGAALEARVVHCPACRRFVQSPVVPAVPAAWYEDPNDSSNYRYWDGSRWTGETAPRLLK